jgi:NTE family protein
MFPLSQMKTALVLSGGGMFGAYQAGAWKALSRVQFTPDIVVGASVGALNGWYIASGLTADDLERHWLDPAAGEIMAYRVARSPWSGFDPRPLEKRAKFMVENYRPRVDFGVALIRLPRLRRTLVRDREVSWRHLVASCAVPVGFPPVRIGGALYCDGGLLEATPVWAAMQMGANRVIAVNASRFVPPPGIGMMIKAVRLLGRRPDPIGADVVMVTPKEPLGRMLDGAIWRREKIREWIEMGDADAMAAMKTVFA